MQQWGKFAEAVTSSPCPPHWRGELAALALHRPCFLARRKGAAPVQPADKIPAIAQRNIEAVARLEQEVFQRRSRLDRASDAISAFVGSIRFVLAHGLAFAGWVAVNAGAVPGVSPF